MQGRIGALHLHYSAPSGGSTVAALAPGLDRALQSGLGDALGERLSSMLGTDTSVVVIRELTARVVMGRSDWSLDSRVVDKISRSSADAVSRVLSGESSPESVVRFADQAEFIGSFILDLIGGSAWERWYYGAFRRYRQSDATATIQAVLTDHRAHAARVFGWLARRGQLATVLAVIGAAAARRLATASSEEAEAFSVPSQIAPLAAVAFRLLDALGWRAGDETARAELLSRYLATDPIPPTWTDRRSLSAWVLELVRFAVNTLAGREALLGAYDADLVGQLLTGPLDWLDGSWLARQLADLSHGSSASGTPTGSQPRRVLAARHEQVLQRIAELMRDGRIRIDRTDESDALIVRLVAAMSDADSDHGPPERAMVAVVERIVDAWRAVIVGGVATKRVTAAIDVAASSAFRLFSLDDAELTRGIEAVQAAGPAALELLSELVKATSAVDQGGDLTPGAGLFLLARGILDVKLSALALDAGVPLAPLLGALAMKWLGLAPPFDGPTALWVGAESPDLDALEAPDARLADLQQALLELLIDQRTFDLESANDMFVADAAHSSLELGCSAATDLAIARIGSMVMRAWSRWLPGFSGASTPFLVQNSLQRLGRVRVSNHLVDVQLDPAPLDVVLEMAGYFRSIELVPWLDGRTITFAVRRSPSA